MKNFYVTSLRFDRDGWSYPRRIELDGVSYCLSDKALKLRVRRQGVQSLLLTATDGIRTFHLSGYNHGNSWRLLNIIG